MHLFQSFRAARWIRTTNLVLQAILFVIFFGGLNYLALHYSWRFDLTQLRRHSLSAETLAYLGQLGQPEHPVAPINIVITLPKDSTSAGADALPDLEQINNDVNSLLREYTYAIEAKHAVSLNIEYIDIYQRPRDAERRKLEINTITFICGERTHTIRINELYLLKNNQRTAFAGEQVFTSAILDVTSPKQKKIYFLTHHGEMDINSVDYARGLSEIRDAVSTRNYAIDTLDLSRTRAIPADAELLLIIGPQTRYEPYEQELLRQYMATRAGRIIYCATPGVSPTGLDELLGEWGILVDNTWVYDRSSSGQSGGYGDLILSAFRPHDITHALIDNQMLLRFGNTRSARPDPTRATDPGLAVTPLVITGSSTWAERDYQLRRTPRYDAGVDIPGPFPVVTVAERISITQDKLPFSVPVGRIVAFGCSDFIANGRLRAGANNAIFLSTLNWLVDPEVSLSIPARPIEKFQLALKRDQLGHLRFMLLFGVPGIFALLGIIVYWTRRK